MTAATLMLLASDGTTTTVEQTEPWRFVRPEALRSRTAFAAAHVVPRVAGDNTPGVPAEIDWDSTLAYRHHLWSWGLGVADAMDTAQRNMGLDPAAVRELIVRSAAEAEGVARRRGAAVSDVLVVGVGTDHLLDDDLSLEAVVEAYSEQLAVVEETGAGVVLMASRHLARAARSAADYARVYREVLERAMSPVILHWLGPAFDPRLSGYFGSVDTRDAARALLDVIAASDRVRGVKMSLLDADLEIDVRRRLPDGVRLFTGNDFGYVDLIAGDVGGHSDALLGAFAAIAPHASAAIQRLDDDDVDGYRRILGPTEVLSRRIFAAPTPFYKTGIAFLSWLNGRQSGFSMVGGLQSARSLPHLSAIVEAANACGALEDPELAAERWHALLAVGGVVRIGRT